MTALSARAHGAILSLHTRHPSRADPIAAEPWVQLNARQVPVPLDCARENLELDVPVGVD